MSPVSPVFHTEVTVSIGLKTNLEINQVFFISITRELSGIIKDLESQHKYDKQFRISVQVNTMLYCISVMLKCLYMVYIDITRDYIAEGY